MLAAAIGLGADDSLIYKLIDLGVPLDTVVRVGRRPVEYMPLGAFLGHQAASTGRAELLGSLASNGWLENVPLRGLNEAFLNGNSCDGRIPQILVEAGVKPTVRDEWGATALMKIRSTCRNAGSRGANYIRSLLRLGVPLEARDKEGRTALFQLSEPEIADALLQEGANPRVLDGKGNSAVHSSSDDRVTVTLLDAGASPDGRNVYGWTLREAARRQGWVGTLSWLDQRGLP
jgi:ankyrin repeat protein